MRFHQTTLDNGLQVIAELNDRAHSVAAGFFVKTGSRDESSELAGVSHFLEHMTFKGTPRRDALAVNRDFDRVGAKHNAQTSEEDTFYHVTCLPEYLPSVVRRPLRYPPADTPRRRLRDREAGDHRRDPDVPGQPDVGGLRGGQDSPLRPSPAGQQHPRNRRVDHRHDGRPDATSTSPVDTARPISCWPSPARRSGTRSSSWRRRIAGRGRAVPASRHAVPPRGTGAFQTILRADDQQQTVVGVGDGPPLESPDRYAAHLLATILGDHTGSRLYWTLIDPGHADGAELSYQDYNQAGAFFTFLSCEPESTQANLGRIAEGLHAP